MAKFVIGMLGAIEEFTVEQFGTYLFQCNGIAVVFVGHLHHASEFNIHDLVEINAIHVLLDHMKVAMRCDKQSTIQWLPILQRVLASTTY